MTERSYDLVLFGATGFTGKLVAEYLAEHAPEGLRWALAGRSRGKLEAVRAELARARGALASLPVEIADSHDEAAMDALAARARVVCTTVGPYMRYGRALVAACARRGTHYCDLTGETPFIRASIDAHHDEATAARARIVHCCGYDSIPSDLGVHLLHEHAARAHGAKLAWVKLFATAKGAASGGTIASALGLVDAGKASREARRLLADPYALTPGRRGPDRSDSQGVRFDRDIGRWTGPFPMAPVNAPIVRRSNALLERDGDDFRYHEAMSFGAGPSGLAAATAVAAGLAGFLAAAAVPPVRSVLEERVLPAPGEGPSAEERASGWFRMRLVGETQADAGGRTHRVEARVEGKGDPGYAATATMLGEAALCLALDEARLEPRFGVLTPASAMGMVLVERLRAVGIDFQAGDRAR